MKYKPNSRRAWEEKAVKEAVQYTVLMWIGPGRWRRWESRTFAEAKARKADIGTDEYGRRPLIYGVLANGYSIHIE